MALQKELKQRIYKHSRANGINSHIQLPRFILKQFMDPALQKVHYLDLQKGFIAKRGTRALGVSKNYYSTSVEEYLSCNYETPIAKVIGRLIPLINGDADKVTLYD